MKKIMILGASILQLPAILKAKEMGIEVIAVDMDENAIGFGYADKKLVISTIDGEKVLEAAKKHKIDGIMTLASDMPMRTVAKVSKALNLIGVTEDTAMKATNKALMRQCLLENSVPIPKFFKVNNLDDYLNCISQFDSKIIVKPADNSGSRGVFLLKDKSDKKNVEYAFKYSKEHSRSGELVVEEYMEGPEVSVESVCVNGEVNIIAITDKLTTGEPKFVEMGHSQPSVLSQNIQAEIRKITKEAIKAIKLTDGPSHTEIKITNEGPKIVEIGARLGGDNITTHLVPLSTGVDLVKACIEISLGIKPNLEKKYDKASVIRYFTNDFGKILEINGYEDANKINEVKQISFVKKIGDYLDGINSSSDRVGFIIAQSENIDKAIEICERAKSLIDIRMER